MESKKVVILDVDGVLAEHGEPISFEVSKILKEISKYTRVALASGKPASYLEGFSRGIGLPETIIIGENGGVIYFPEKREEIVFSDIYPEVNKELRILRRELIKRLNQKCWFQPNKVVVTAFPKSDFTIEETEINFIDVIEKYGLKSIRLFIHADAIDAVPESLDKGWAVDKLSAVLNLKNTDLISVGDSDNDIPMLRKTGFSICVGNNKNVKKVADKIFSTGIEALNYILSLI